MFPFSISRFRYSIKKESPNEGTETVCLRDSVVIAALIKKESPNEGTETLSVISSMRISIFFIKKESPNEGTETFFLSVNH